MSASRAVAKASCALLAMRGQESPPPPGPSLIPVADGTARPLPDPAGARGFGSVLVEALVPGLLCPDQHLPGSVPSVSSAETGDGPVEPTVVPESKPGCGVSWRLGVEDARSTLLLLEFGLSGPSVSENLC